MSPSVNPALQTRPLALFAWPLEGSEKRRPSTLSLFEKDEEEEVIGGRTTLELLGIHPELENFGASDT